MPLCVSLARSELCLPLTPLVSSICAARRVLAALFPLSPPRLHGLSPLVSRESWSRLGQVLAAQFPQSWTGATRLVTRLPLSPSRLSVSVVSPSLALSPLLCAASPVLQGRPDSDVCLACFPLFCFPSCALQDCELELPSSLVSRQMLVKLGRVLAALSPPASPCLPLCPFIRAASLVKVGRVCCGARPVKIGRVLASVSFVSPCLPSHVLHGRSSRSSFLREARSFLRKESLPAAVKSSARCKLAGAQSVSRPAFSKEKIRSQRDGLRRGAKSRMPKIQTRVQLMFLGREQRKEQV